MTSSSLRVRLVLLIFYKLILCLVTLQNSLINFNYFLILLAFLCHLKVITVLYLSSQLLYPFFFFFKLHRNLTFLSDC